MIVAYRRVAVVWAIVGLLLLSWSGFAAIGNASARSDYHAAQKQTAVLDHFWRVVAGSEPGSEENVVNKLARDLHDLTPSQLYTYRGDSNRYGGIKGELGFDPFVGDNCSECGPLSIPIITQAIEVKNGGLADVIAKEQPKRPAHHSGAWTPLWILWVLALPASLVSLLLGANRVRERRYREMGGEMNLIHRMDHQLEQTFENPQDRYELEALRNKLMSEIDTRVKYGQRAKQTMQLERLKQEASDSLSSIEQGNKALQ